MTPSIPEFRQIIYEYYHQNRRQFPWRETTDAYKIWVSEIMLQQTQANRVIPKYENFIQKFPTVTDLGQAETSDLLVAWQGLGYNRRALSLRQGAQQVMERGGEMPCTQEELDELPGVGINTAGAIMAFAYNAPVTFIETNIRRVFIHFFFPDQEEVHDRDLMPLIEQAVDQEHSRDWYYALMDYGAQMPKKIVNPNRRSAHYAKQSKFEGSHRQIRGRILKALAERPELSMTILLEMIDRPPERVEACLLELQNEGFLLWESQTIRLA